MNQTISYDKYLTKYHSIYTKQSRWHQSQSDILHDICRISMIEWIYMRYLGIIIILKIINNQKTHILQCQWFNHSHILNIKDKSISKRYKYTFLIIKHILYSIKILSILFQYHLYSFIDSLFSHLYKSFNKSYFVNKMRELFLHAEISSDHISDHSIKKNAVISAATNEISREDIKLLERWKSDAVDVYINELAKDEHIKKILQINAYLHIFKQHIFINNIIYLMLLWYWRYKLLSRIILASRK